MLVIVYRNNFEWPKIDYIENIFKIIIHKESTNEIILLAISIHNQTFSSALNLSLGLYK